MDPGCPQHMGVNKLVERHQRQGSGVELIAKVRDAERHAFLSEALGLMVEG